MHVYKTCIVCDRSMLGACPAAMLKNAVFMYMCLLHKPSLKSNRCQTAIESLCWLCVCVCVRKQQLDRSAGVCAYEINLIAMWLVHTNDSVPYICSVASSLHSKHAYCVCSSRKWRANFFELAFFFQHSHTKLGSAFATLQWHTKLASQVPLG